jgi:hypothetical protein
MRDVPTPLLKASRFQPKSKILVISRPREVQAEQAAISIGAAILQRSTRFTSRSPTSFRL